MPTTRKQAADARNVEFILTLDDTAKKLTRVSGCLHSIANLINDTIDGRPGFFSKFRRSGENSSANARALWRYHDRRWKEAVPDPNNDDNGDEDNDEDDDGEEEPIDTEVDRRIGQNFSFSRAVELALALIDTAINVLRSRKAEMEQWNDVDGALLLQAFIEAYDKERIGWATVEQHLGRCSTYMCESVLDTSLRHGWL